MMRVCLGNKIMRFAIMYEYSVSRSQMKCCSNMSLVLLDYQPVFYYIYV